MVAGLSGKLGSRSWGFLSFSFKGSFGTDIVSYWFYQSWGGVAQGFRASILLRVRTERGRRERPPPPPPPHHPYPLIIQVWVIMLRYYICWIKLLSYWVAHTPRWMKHSEKALELKASGHAGIRCGGGSLHPRLRRRPICFFIYSGTPVILKLQATVTNTSPIKSWLLQRCAGPFHRSYQWQELRCHQCQCLPWLSRKGPTVVRLCARRLA